jgi:thioredoxin 1
MSTLADMKRIIISFVLLVFLFSGSYGQNKQNQGNVVHLTNDQFKKLVFNYETGKEWKYLGDKPCIIDFYADWCGPCRMMAPRLDEVAREYAGKIVVYKVDTEKEKLLASALGIQSLPTLLFIPQKGQPRGSLGAIPKESLVKAIHDVLLTN